MANLAQGQRVMVSNGGELKERLYLTTNEEGKHICVHQNDEAQYEAGEYFRVGLWSELETIPSDLGNFETGEEIMVSNGGTNFVRRIFLGTVGNRILAVHNSEADKYRDGGRNIKSALWNTAKPALEKLSKEELADMGYEMA